MPIPLEFQQHVRETINAHFDNNYYSGAPKIPPHTHNGVDNLQINIGDLTGVPSPLSVIFDADGDYIIPPNVSFVLIEMIAAGGGASIGTQNGTIGSGGGGGGAGAWLRKIIDVSTYTSLSITVGEGGPGGIFGSTWQGIDGGDTEIIALDLTCGGGKGAPDMGGARVGVFTPGLGGVATGGDVNVTGGDGFAGIGFAAASIAGHGAASFYGGGGFGAIATGATTGQGAPGRAPGSGGGGTAIGPTSGTHPDSGAGADGQVIITPLII